MFTGLGIILVVTGAILTFAVERQVDGVDLGALGWIVMTGGFVSLVVGAIEAASWVGLQRRSMRVERHRSADGRHVVEETVVR